MYVHRYNYLITANPPSSQSGDSEQPIGHHVRLKPAPTVTSKQLVEQMHHCDPSVSRGTCHAALSALATALGELLADGHVVEIPYVGTLRPRITGRVTEGARGLTAHDVHVCGIQFTPDADLLVQANKSRPVLARRGARALPSPEELTAFLDEHFAQAERLTRKTVVERFHLTKEQALGVLRRLVAEGRLAARGSRATTHYVRPARQADADAPRKR